MTWSHSAFRDVALTLGRKTGLSFAPARQPIVEEGIRRAMRRAGAKDLVAYRNLIERQGEALDDLIGELTVGETYFFREPAQFAFIRREVLPGLRFAARAMGQQEPCIRAWSAGCASGEEAYSLAALLEEEGVDQRACVLGTDISQDALAKAEQAVYTSWSLRGEGAALMRPYLQPRNSGWLVAEKVRRRVTFAHLNLALDVYPSVVRGVWDMDVILCRNVLIYFNGDTVREVAGRLFACLAPGGWLFTASSDPPLGSFAPFESVLTEKGVFYRRPCSAEQTIPHFPAAMDPLAHPVPAAEADPIRIDESTPQPNPLPEAEREGRNPHPPTPSPKEGEGEQDLWPPLSPRWERGLGGEVSAGLGGGVLSQALSEARAAFARGAYEQTLESTDSLTSDADACALRVRALANLDPVRAERESAAAVSRHPLRAELHYLHGTILLGRGKTSEAAQALRKALYLDRSLAAVHFALGAILEQCGDAAGARRAYRNACDLCAAGSAEEEVPLADGERAGRLAEAARARLARLGEERSRQRQAPR